MSLLNEGETVRPALPRHLGRVVPAVAVADVIEPVCEVEDDVVVPKATEVDEETVLAAKGIAVLVFLAAIYNFSPKKAQ